MAKLVKGVGQATLGGLGKLTSGKVNEEDFVKVVVCIRAFEPPTNPG